MQQRLKRRARRFDAAVRKIAPCHTCLRIHDGVDAGRERRKILLLWAQHLGRKYRVRSLEEPTQEVVDEPRRDAVSKPASENLATFEIEVFYLFQVPILNQIRRIALVHLHAAPDL